MKKKLFLFLVLLCICVLYSGCKKIRVVIPRRPKESKSIVNKIESIELAKIVLRPKPYHFKARDPFRPLVGKNILFGERVDVKVDLDLLGIVNLGKDYLALIKTPSKAEVLKKNDKIAGFIIENICSDKVILRKGGKTVILKIRR